jgi:L-ascorbate metabolism protein UlaG (beta-lactamase superfamily)
MKITKFEHSCLLVEMPEPVNRTALFDPGEMSTPLIDIDELEYLDDIFITHIHPDHYDKEFIKKLVAKFPDVRITAPGEIVADLQADGITASTEPPEGVSFFDSPHESVEPMFPAPQEIGIHYLDLLSHPGDSHSFTETKQILALPITAPWGSSVKALNLAIELKPKYVVPIHDWHWRDEARISSYDRYEKVLGERGITFLKVKNGEPVIIDV